MSLGEVLESNTSLTDLNLSLNPIGDDGITCLGLSLASNHTLKTLEIEYSGFTELGVVSLATMLFHSTTIANILWDGNRKMSKEELKPRLEQCGLWTPSVAAVLFDSAF